MESYRKSANCCQKFIYAAQAVKVAKYTSYVRMVVMGKPELLNSRNHRFSCSSLEKFDLAKVMSDREK